MTGSRVIGGRYLVLDELGRGGMGVVWRAEDQVLGRHVAVKELRLPEGLAPAEHAQFRERLLREARTAGRLNHPSIVTVHDVVADADVDHIVMELVEARTLAEIVATDGPLDERTVTDVARQVLGALRRAHAAGVVHRDVKPSNVMLGEDGRVTLTDFGIAQAVDDPRLTTTGLLVGSPGYMAPERLAGEPAAPPADLWALGATLHHALEGTGPFQRDSTPATIYAVMNTDPPPLHSRGPLGPVVAGLLIRSPQARLTAEQALVLLAAGPPADESATRQVMASTNPFGRGVAAAPRRRAWVVAAVVAVLGLVLGAAAGWLLAPRSDGNDVRVLRYGPGGDLPVFEINYPTCLNAQLLPGRVVSSAAAVSCDDPHDLELFEAMAPFDTRSDLPYPAAEDLATFGAAACRMVFGSDQVAGDDKASLTVAALVPTEPTFAAASAGSRAVYCLLGAADGSQLTGARKTGSS